MLFWCKKSFSAFGCSAYFPPLTNILFKLDFLRNTLFTFGFSTISANGLRLGDGGAIEAQKFSFAQMLNRITNVEFCTSAPLLPSRC
jgi:hypothetical protein